MAKFPRRWATVGVAAFVSTAGIGVALTGGPASATDVVAEATLYNAAGKEIGEVTFKGEGKFATEVEIEIDAPANTPNLGKYHGIHIHTTGVCTAPATGPAFLSAGGHWNPAGASIHHGDHAGDLPSVLLTKDGMAYAEFETDRFDVSELFDTDGSAVILHVGADNFANIPLDPYGGPNAATRLTGDAGGRYACGVIE